MGFLFFYLLFACPAANIGPFLSGQSLSLNVNHCACKFSSKDYWNPRNEVASLSLAERLLTGHLPIRCQFIADIYSMLYFLSDVHTNMLQPHKKQHKVTCNNS